MTPRRNFLYWATGGWIALGFGMAGAGLLRSCAPREPRVTYIDLGKMTVNGGIYRFYLNEKWYFLIREATHFRCFLDYCPADVWSLDYHPDKSAFWCMKCTREYDKDGISTNRGHYEMIAGEIPVDGLILTLAESDGSPKLGTLWEPA